MFRILIYPILNIPSDSTVCYSLINRLCSGEKVSQGPNWKVSIAPNWTSLMAIPLFLLLSPDWPSRWAAFSRHLKIPPIHLSFRSGNLHRQFSSRLLTNLTPWGVWKKICPWVGEINIKCTGTERGFVESFNSSSGLLTDARNGGYGLELSKTQYIFFFSNVN